MPPQDVENVAKELDETEEDGLDPQAYNDSALGETEGVFLSPHSSSFQSLVNVDKEELAAEQANDSTLKDLGGFHQGFSKRNVSFQTRSGIRYRQHRDHRGIVSTSWLCRQNTTETFFVFLTVVRGRVTWV